MWNYEVVIGNFTSIEMSRVRCECQCDDASSEKKGLFTVGATVQCWGPADIDSFGVGTDTDSYACGNDACYKLTDPADDASALLDVASSLITVAVIFMICGCCICSPCAARAYRGGWNNQNNPK